MKLALLLFTTAIILTVLKVISGGPGVDGLTLIVFILLVCAVLRAGVTSGARR